MSRQETFAKSKDLLKKIFFNLSGSENLKKQGSEKRIFFARLDCFAISCAIECGIGSGIPYGIGYIKKKFFLKIKILKTKGFRGNDSRAYPMAQGMAYFIFRVKKKSPS